MSKKNIRGRKTDKQWIIDEAYLQDIQYEYDELNGSWREKNKVQEQSIMVLISVT